MSFIGQRMKPCARAIAAVSFALAAPLPCAHALALYVEAGTEVGQGFAYRIGDACFAVMPNHLTAALHLGASVRVTDDQGRIATATLVAQNPGYDLALARLSDARDAKVICNSGFKVRSQSGLNSMTDAWHVTLPIESVASRAGGLTTFNPESFSAAGGDPFNLKLVLREGETLPQGISGSLLWMSEYESKITAPLRGGFGLVGYDKEHVVDGRRSFPLGIVLGVSGEQSKEVPHGFFGKRQVIQQTVYGLTIWRALSHVIAMAAPVDIPAINSASGASLFSADRGGVATWDQGSGRGSALEVAATARLVYDLGDQDAIVRQLSVAFLPRNASRAHVNNAGSSVEIIVDVSMSRPSEEPRWVTIPCLIKGAIRISQTKVTRAACELSESRIARAIRITVRGEPWLLQSMDLEIER